jgi:carbonic anhydrase/acetyltransferase-like protein (isoleucine patch superfamily)
MILQKRILPYGGTLPQLGEGVFLAPTACLIGDIIVGDDSSFWFNVTVRGDVNYIRVGERTNIQDGSVLHVTSKKYPLFIGNGVTGGHSVVLHGCEIMDDCLIGIGARILDGAVIEKESIVGAGAVVSPGTALGIPAKVVRPLKDEEFELINRTAEHYIVLKNEYLKYLK